MTIEYTPQQILALPMEENDAKAATIGQYLSVLLKKIWDEEEGFSGKRPFGNSGWQSDVNLALIKAEAVQGYVDEGGWLQGYSLQEIDNLMKDVFSFLIIADWTTLQRPPEPKDFYLIKFDSTGEMVDQDCKPYTKDEAEEELKTPFHANNPTGWRIIHIPKES